MIEKIDNKAENIDYKFVQLLVAGESEAWNRLYKEFRERIEIYINKKYPNVFNDIAIEEIYDGVLKRLVENDYKTLRNYRGDCIFSTYLTQAAEWEVKDWLRKHSEELLNVHLEILNDHNPVLEDKGASFNSFHKQGGEEEAIPEAIKSLNDDLRWTFLLRYYDYFGFPLEEIRLLAKKKGVLIGTITEKIINFIELGRQDILKAQREKLRIFQSKLQKICCKAQKLTQNEKKLSADIEEATLYYDEQDKEKTEKLNIVRDKIYRLKEKRETLLNSRAKFAITTPYEVIAEILLEENVSTIRSRVFHAKKELIRKLKRV